MTDVVIVQPDSTHIVVKVPGPQGPPGPPGNADNVGDFVTDAELATALAQKANVADVYTKTQADARYATDAELAAALLGYAPVNDPRFTNTRTPTDGSVTTIKIAPGAVTDVQVAAANKDGAANVPSMRTLGTGANQAVSGTDPRLSDARPPTAHTHPVTDISATGTRNALTFLRGDGSWAVPAGGSGGTTGTGVSDHGDLTGLGDDDHQQYLTAARAAALHYTKAEVDTAVSGGNAAKTATDAATNINTPNTIVKRSADGVSNFSRVIVTGDPTDVNELARKSYVDAGDASGIAAKAVTDTATNLSTPNALARRDASGNATFARVFSDNAPAAANELARKDYVDTAVAGRATAGHTHDLRYLRTVNNVGPDETGNVNIVVGAPDPSNYVDKTKVTLQSMSNSTTLVNDNDLNFNIAAFDIWDVHMFVAYDADTSSDVQFALTVPAGAVMRGRMEGLTVGVAGSGGSQLRATLDASGQAYAFGALGAGVLCSVDISFRVTAGATPGTVNLRFAQMATNVVPLRIREGSYLVAIKR